LQNIISKESNLKQSLDETEVIDIFAEPIQNENN
jgi:hypothetical protein